MIDLFIFCDQTGKKMDIFKPWKRGHIFQTAIGPSLLNWPAPISKRKTGSPMKIRETM